MIGSEHEAWKMFKHPDPKSLLFVLKKPPSKQPQHVLTPSRSLNGNTFSTDKALFGHMSCHPDRAWGGCTLPQATEKTSLRRSTSITSHSMDSDSHSRPLSSSSPSTSDGLLKSLPQWSRKGRRGGRGAPVSASLSSSAAAASSASHDDSSGTAKEDRKKKKKEKKRKEKEEVEIDPELESLRRLLMLAVDSHRQSSSPPRPIVDQDSRVLTGALPRKKHRTMALPLTLPPPPPPLPLKKYACGDNATAAPNLSCSDDDRNRCNIVRDTTSQEPPTLESGEDCRLMERGQREKKLINVLPFDLNELPCCDD